MIVVRIQDLHNILGKILLLYRLVIVASVKRIQLEVHDRLRIPDTKGIYHMVIVSHDRVVVRYGQYRLIILLNEMGSAFFVILYPDISAKAHFLCVFGPAKFKGIAILEPVIRLLHLISIFNLLLKHSVMITYATAICRIAKGCQRIQEAGRQTAKAAVSKSRIRLLVLDGI